MDAIANPVIATHALSKAYKGVTVLDNLTLQVPKNSIFGFLGPNGAGKSTTIKLLLGLIRPSGGEATVFGNNIQENSVEIRRRVGYLAQEPRYYEHMTARQVLRYTARFFYKGPKNLIEERVDEMIDLVGLEGKADRPIRGFSGGERQRLGIAQAQVNYPDLLILDEPAASLDPMGRHDVLTVMEKLRAYTTIFYSTHILDDVQRVSDTVAILNRGRLIAEAPIGELLAGDGHTTTYSLTLKGDVSQTKSRFENLPWVQDISVIDQNGLTNWLISVSGNDDAEDHILKLVLEDGVQVKQFGKKTYDLEEVFMSLVGKEPTV